VRTACAHCGQPVARAVGGGDVSFCCGGCEAVWHALHEAGLEAYYRVRQDLPAAAELDASEFELDERLLEAGPGGCRASFAVDGIHCASCAWVIEEVLRREPSVRSARVALARERLIVELRPDGDPRAVVRALRRVGYGARLCAESADDDGGARRGELLRFGVAAACAMNLMLFSVSLYGGARWGIDPALERLFRWLSLGVATPLVGYSARPILARAVAAVRNRTIHVDVPVAVAIAVMYGTSAWATASGGGAVWFDSLGMLVALLLGGRLIEGAVRRHAGERLSALVGRQTETARRLTAAGVQRVAPEALRPGDRVELLPGDVAPVDVALSAGTSDVDLSVVDGESQPRAVAAGRDLPAGARVLTGRLEGTVLRTAAAGSLAGLRAQVDDALARRSPAELLADRVARWFVAAVLVLAAGTAAAWWGVDPGRALPITVAVLVVACPCALALATPLAFAAAVHGAAARGLVVREGAALLALGRIDRIAFDKTGTLTEGRLVAGAFDAPGGDEAATLRLAAAACRGSLHPVARAVVQAAKDRGIGDVPLSSELRETAGSGLEASVEGHRVAVGRPGATVRIDGREAGRLLLSDRVRPGAADAVRRLRALGIEPAMLSGDEPSVADALAREIGISTAHGGLLPTEKAAMLRAWRGEGSALAFVGDGLTDAPALAAADVGIAMGSAVDLSVEAADGALLRRGLGAVADSVILGRRLRRTLIQNVVWSVGYNLGAVTAAASGLLSPLEAAALMPLSSVVVVVNAARLARRV
jgi:Cu2+-exporting ATPase